MSEIKPLTKDDKEDAGRGIIANTKMAYVLDMLRDNMDLISEACAIFESFPLHVRERINTSSPDLAIFFSNLPQKQRDVWQQWQRDIYDILEAMAGTTKPWLPSEDEEVVILLVKILPRLQIRSKRQLRQFLEAAIDGDNGYLFVENKGSKAEVRHRHKVPETVKEEFDISG